jgi:hypothetical protein
MSVELAKEIWDETKRYLISTDRAEVADTLVSIMIDHDIDAEEIKEVFKRDVDVKAALEHYLDQGVDYDEDEFPDEEDEDFL